VLLLLPLTAAAEEEEAEEEEEEEEGDYALAKHWKQLAWPHMNQTRYVNVSC
jgi:hypothetical protein